MQINEILNPAAKFRGDFDPYKIKAAVGFGLRFNINRKDPSNVRIDFGYGFEKNAKSVYITFGEAF